MKYLLTTIMTALMLTAGTALAQQDTPKPDKLFESHERMQVTLKGPWRRMTRRVTSDATFDGQLTYTDSNGVQQTLDVACFVVLAFIGDFELADVTLFDRVQDVDDGNVPVD